MRLENISILGPFSPLTHGWEWERLDLWDCPYFCGGAILLIFNHNETDGPFYLHISKQPKPDYVHVYMWREPNDEESTDPPLIRLEGGKKYQLCATTNPIFNTYETGNYYVKLQKAEGSPL